LGRTALRSVRKARKGRKGEISRGEKTISAKLGPTDC